VARRRGVSGKKFQSRRQSGNSITIANIKALSRASKTIRCMFFRVEYSNPIRSLTAELPSHRASGFIHAISSHFCPCVCLVFRHLSTTLMKRLAPVCLIIVQTLSGAAGMVGNITAGECEDCQVRYQPLTDRRILCSRALCFGRLSHTCKLLHLSETRPLWICFNRDAGSHW
jgi:hypothetical protein